MLGKCRENRGIKLKNPCVNRGLGEMLVTSAGPRISTIFILNNINLYN